MASEGGQREEALIEHGCNYYGKTVTRSAPFAIFMRQDILQLALDMDQWYHEHLELFETLYHAQPYGKNKDGSLKEYVPLKSIVPVCVALASIWKKGRIDSISSGKEIKRNGNFGCIVVAPIRKQVKSLDGAEYLII